MAYIWQQKENNLNNDFKGSIKKMDIQTNIDMLMQADLKDWHHYENERKMQELCELLEQIQTQIGV